MRIDELAKVSAIHAKFLSKLEVGQLARVDKRPHYPF
jgi:hypothetical protein